MDVKARGYPRAQLRVLEGPTGTIGTTMGRDSSKREPLRGPGICCLAGRRRSSEMVFGEEVGRGKMSGEDGAEDGGFTMRTILSRKRFHSWLDQLCSRVSVGV